MYSPAVLGDVSDSNLTGRAEPKPEIESAYSRDLIEEKADFECLSSYGYLDLNLGPSEGKEKKRQAGHDKPCNIAFSRSKDCREGSEKDEKTAHSKELYVCATCGAKTEATRDGCICQCCSSKMKQDGGNRTLNELRAYAQNIATSVKNLLSSKVIAPVRKEEKAASKPVEQMDSQVSRKGYIQRHSSDPLQNSKSSTDAVSRSSSLILPTKEKHVPFCVYRQNKFNSDRPSIRSQSTGKPLCGKSASRHMGTAYGTARVKKSASKTSSVRGSNEALLNTRSVLKDASADEIAIHKCDFVKTGLTCRSKTYGSRMLRTRTDNDLKAESDNLFKRPIKMNIKHDEKGCGKLNRIQKAQTFHYNQELVPGNNANCRSQALSSVRLLMEEGSSVDPPTNRNPEGFTSRTTIFQRKRSDSQRSIVRSSFIRNDRAERKISSMQVKSTTKLPSESNKDSTLSEVTAQTKTEKGDFETDGSVQEITPIFWKGENEIDKKVSPVSKSAKRQAQNAGDGPVQKSKPSLSTGKSAQFLKNNIMDYISRDTCQDTKPDGTPDYCGQLTPYEQANYVQAEDNILDEERSSYVSSLEFYHTDSNDGDFIQAHSESNDISKRNGALTSYFDQMGHGTGDKAIVKGVKSFNEEDLYHGTVSENSALPIKSKESQWYEGTQQTYSNATENTSVLLKASKSDLNFRTSTKQEHGVSARYGKRLIYRETDVDNGTMYHVSRRSSTRLASSLYYAVNASSNFSAFLEDGSQSNSSISVVSDKSSIYTGSIYHTDPFYKNDENSSSSESSQTYFDVPKTNKVISDQDIYTGSVFSNSENCLAMNNPRENWRNQSTNNSNLCPRFRGRLTRTASRRKCKQPLNCSNNSSNWEDGNCPKGNDQRRNNKMLSNSVDEEYEIYKSMRPQIFKSKVRAEPVARVDFTKYDYICSEDSRCFVTVPQSCCNWNAATYEDEFPKYTDLKNVSTGVSLQKPLQQTMPEKDDTYTDDVCPKFKAATSSSSVQLHNLNNNSFGEFYTRDYNHNMSGPKDYSTFYPTNDYQDSPFSPITSDIFYESEYSSADTRAKANISTPAPSVSGMYEDLPQHKSNFPRQYQSSPPVWSNYENEPQKFTYADDPFEEERSVNSSFAPRNSSETYSYFGYHSSSSHDLEHHDQHESTKTTPLIERKKMVGNIICRENVANKEDYAENINRDLADDVWTPITYKLGGPRLREMSSNWKDERNALKTREAVGGLSTQASALHAPCQEQDVKHFELDSTVGSGDIPPLKWKEAREEHWRQRQSSKFNESSKSTSLWGPSDHIPEKARGKRTITKRETKHKEDDSVPGKVWSAVTWVPSKVGTIVKKLW